jgi:hypothetical protein
MAGKKVALEGVMKEQDGFPAIELVSVAEAK